MKAVSAGQTYDFHALFRTVFASSKKRSLYRDDTNASCLHSTRFENVPDAIVDMKKLNRRKMMCIRIRILLRYQSTRCYFQEEVVSVIHPLSARISFAIMQTHNRRSSPVQECLDT